MSLDHRRQSGNSKALDRWAQVDGMTFDFSRPGEPTGNVFAESFNGRLRDACLNALRLLTMATE